MITNYILDPSIIDRSSALKSFPEPKTVYVKGAFDESMATNFAKEVAEAVATGQEVVPVVIDSYGGQVYSLLHMLDTIDNCPVPVATIVQGKAMSCGQILAAAGRYGYRYVTPQSTVMLHELSTGDWDKITDFKATAAWGDALNSRIFAMLDKFAGQVPGYFKKLVHDAGHADITFTAEETVKNGLADRVGVPEWDVKVALSRRFTCK